MQTITKLNLSRGAIKSTTLGELNVLSVNAKAEGDANVISTSINHVLIYDRSYSMRGELENLVRDVQKAAMSLDDKDEVTIFWYSGSGQSGIVLNSKVSELDNNDLAYALNQASSCVGLTVFSETLQAVEKLADSTEKPLAISWFTDGYVCPNNTSSQEEKQLVRESVARLNDHPQVVGINTIGYSNYYDRDLLLSMSAGSTIGAFNHANRIEDYSVIFDEFKAQAKGVIPSVNFNISCKGDLYLSTVTGFKKLEPEAISDDGAKEYSFNELPSEGVRLISTEDIGISSELNCETTIRKINATSAIKYLYGMASVLYITGRREDALDIIETELGDLPLFTSMMTAYTINQIGKTYNEMNKAYKIAKNRSFNTITFDSIIGTDVFTILTDIKTKDAELIMNDAVSNYSRVGIKANEGDSKSTFKYSDAVEPLLTNVANIAFSKEQFSVSIGNVVFPGTLTLEPEDRLLFADAIDGELPVNRIKKYSLIKDGSLNMDFIDVVFSNKMEATKLAKSLTKEGVIVETVVVAGVEALRVTLAGIPLASRDLSRSYTSFAELTSTIEDSVQAKIEKKVLGYFIDKVKKSKPSVKSTPAKRFTTLQLTTLKDNYAVTIYPYGPVYNGFRKPSVVDGDFDIYFTRFMGFGMKGFSTIPKVEDCLNYAPAGKRVSAVKLAVKAEADRIIDLLRGSKIDLSSEKIEKPTKALEILTTMLSKVNNSDDLLEQIKFIKGTTAGFFSDLELPEDLDKKTYEVESNGKVFTLTVSHRKEYID